MRRAARTLTLIATATALLAASDLEDRIKRIENGLPPVTPQGAKDPVTGIADHLKILKTPGASIVVISGGKVEWARGYGVTAADGGKPITPETIFQAGTLSMPVSAMVALRLVDEGKLSLDEDVTRKLRSWKLPKNDFTKTEKVTLRRLLNHSAGINVPRLPGYPGAERVPTLIEALNGVKPATTPPIRVEWTPGSAWRNSAGGYAVLQELIVEVTGKPFAQAARELVLDPLGMSHSTFEQPLPERLQDGAAAGHHGNGTPLEEKWRIYPEAAAAGLWTTPSDLALLVSEILSGGHLLKPETQQAMVTKVVGDYGLGLQLHENNGEKWFSHGGAGQGYMSTMVAYPKGGRGAIIMTNGEEGGGLALEIIGCIGREYGWIGNSQ